MALSEVVHTTIAVVTVGVVAVMPVKLNVSVVNVYSEEVAWFPAPSEEIAL